jgi:phosphate/sulfate permease
LLHQRGGLEGGVLVAGLVAGGMAGVKWVALRDKVALPLAVSPFVSLGLMWLLFPLLRLVASRLRSLDRLHWLSAGATSFARGLNDTPKVLALGVAAAVATGFSVGWRRASACRSPRPMFPPVPSWASVCTTTGDRSGGKPLAKCGWPG